jgi:hypothetical protein
MRKAADQERTPKTFHWLASGRAKVIWPMDYENDSELCKGCPWLALAELSPNGLGLAGQ